MTETNNTRKKEEVLYFDENQSPFTREQIRQLMKSFPKEEIKILDKGHGQKLSYVSGHHVWDRVLKIIGTLFSLTVMAQWKEDYTAWDYKKRAEVTKTDLCVRLRFEMKTKDGQSFVREDYGCQTYNAGMTPGDAWKSAHTDAFKRLGRQLGIGNHLYVGDQDELLFGSEEPVVEGSNAGNGRQAAPAKQPPKKQQTSTKPAASKQKETPPAQESLPEEPPSSREGPLTQAQLETVSGFNNAFYSKRAFEVYSRQFLTSPDEVISSANFETCLSWLKSTVWPLVNSCRKAAGEETIQTLDGHIKTWNESYTSVLDIPVNELPNFLDHLNKKFSKAAA